MYPSSKNKAHKTHKLTEEQQIIEEGYQTQGTHSLYIGGSKHKLTSQIVFKKVLLNINTRTLETIILHNMEIEHQAVSVMSEFPLNKLKTLNFQGSKIGELGVEKLIKKQWPALKDLHLIENNIGDGGLQKLFASEIPNQLELLDLSYNQIRSDGLKYFECRNLKNLKKLTLQGNKLGKSGIQHLIKNDLTQLEILNLVNAQLTNQSINHLCKAQLSNLRKLQINLNNITPDCLSYHEGVTWELDKLWTPFTKPIFKRSKGKRGFNILMRHVRTTFDVTDKQVEGIGALMKADVTIQFI